MNKVKVMYHFPCPDGAYSALAAYLGLVKGLGKGVDFVPHSTYSSYDLAGDPAGVKGPEKTVYLLDYVGPPSFIPEVCASGANVVLIDHHKTALQLHEEWSASNVLPASLNVTLNMDRSGAALALEHFRPHIAADALSHSLERVYALVEDHDLFLHALDGSREFAAGLAALNLQFDASAAPDEVFAALAAVDPDAVIASGRTIRTENQRIIDAEIAASFIVRLPDGRRALAVRTAAPHLRSELGNQLATAAQARGLDPIAAVTYVEKRAAAGSLKISLRSLADVDVADTARALGGGGHRNAASCNVDVAEFDSKWVE